MFSGRVIRLVCVFSAVFTIIKLGEGFQMVYNNYLGGDGQSLTGFEHSLDDALV